MSLQNLLGISLETVEPNAQHVALLRAAAERNIADAQIAGLSEENQFDAGYRTLTSKPGHHQTAIQTLALTVQWPAEKIWPLDALRKQRNLTDYSGEPVSKAAVDSCLSNAKALQAHVHAWLQGHRADWLS